jgi:hypothetical protein
VDGQWLLGTSPGRYLLLVVMVLVIGLVYWPGLGGGFVFDDYPNIVFNNNLHVTGLDRDKWVAAILSSPAKELPRPLAMLSFAINYYFTGLNPWPMKATNLAIHLLNALLVYAFTSALLRARAKTGGQPADDRVALFASACWAAMPINLIPVLLVVQRMEILSHSFVFLGLWLYLCGRLRQLNGRQGWVHILAGLVLCTGLGVMSKESAALLPLYALLIELFVLKFKGPHRLQSRWLIALYVLVVVLPAILGLAWLLPTSLNPGSFAHRNFSLLERLMTEPRVVADYLHWTLLPNLSQLSLFHDDYPVSRGLLTTPATLLSAIVLAILAAGVWWQRHTRPLAALGLAWFLGAQLLTATIIPLELVFEHRNYFASIGISLLLADLLLVAPVGSRYRPTLGPAAILLLIFYAGTCHLRALDWSNSLRFAQTEAAKHPQSPRATYNLAQTLAILSGGDVKSPFTPAAFAAFDRARLAPNAGIAPAQGALLLATRTGAPLKPDWWQEIQDRLRQQPIGAQELGALGALTSCAISGRCHFPPDEMVAMYAAALSHGDNPEVLSIYGNYALNVLDDEPLAERLWREASRLSPGEPEYVIGLAKLMMAVGRDAEAEMEIQRLRSMGRLGQYKPAADSLELRRTVVRKERHNIH